MHALRDIDLTVDAGALVAVMGPSGSGKSTLLTIAGSLEDATEGEVVIAGHALTGMSRNDKARLRRRSIGYVFQDFNLLPGLTVAENVALPLELDGLSARKAQAAGLEVLEELGLADQGHALSRHAVRGRAPAGGYRAGRSSVSESSSSPTSRRGALDSVNGEAVMRLVLGVCRRRLAAVVVTHDAKLRLVGRPRRVHPRRLDRGRDLLRIRSGSAAREIPADDAHPGPAGRRPGLEAMEVCPPAVPVVRWAWRLFFREWRQQLLVLALVIVAVAITVVGAGVAVNTPTPSNAGFGTADAMVQLPASDPKLASSIAGLEHKVGTVDVIEKHDRPGSRVDRHLPAPGPEPRRHLRQGHVGRGQRTLPSNGRRGGRYLRRGLGLRAPRGKCLA